MNIVNELQPEHLAYWADQPEAAPITMKSPAGLEDCSDCSAVLTRNEHGERVVRVAWKPDEIELPPRRPTAADAMREKWGKA